MAKHTTSDVSTGSFNDRQTCRFPHPLVPGKSTLLNVLAGRCAGKGDGFVALRLGKDVLFRDLQCFSSAAGFIC